MVRLGTSPALPQTLLSARKALNRLRFVLNHQAAAKLEGLIKAAEGRAASAGKQPPELKWRKAGRGGGDD